MSTGRSIGGEAVRSETPAAGAIYDFALLKRLWQYLRPYSGAAGCSLALLMLHSALGACWPFLTQVAVDRYLKPDPSGTSFLDPYLPSEPLEGILWVLGLYVAILVLSGAARAAQIHTMNFTGQRVMRDIRREIFRHLQRLPVPYFDRTPSGRLITRATTDVDVLNEVFTSGLVAVAGDILTLVCAFAAMMYLSPQLTLVYLAVAPLVLIVSVVFRKHARASFRDVRAAVAKLASFLQECFTGITEIQLFNHQPRAVQDFAAINDEHRLANYRAVRAHALFFPVIDWLNMFGLALLIWFGGNWVVEGTVTLGVLLAFLQYGTKVFRPIQDLAEKYNVLQAAMAGAERIFELLDTDLPLPTRREKDRKLARSSIEFRNVWFAYKGEDWVLRDVSFYVEAGNMLAIVGHTGAGKSTLVNLVLRYYEIQKGSILVGGRDIRTWTPESLRAQFGVVLQDPCLLSGTISENIGLSDEAVAEAEIRRAATNAHLAQHIESLPQRYEEQLLERGAGLSTGQKQLVAFARALAHDRPFLILDEATSSVDPETERDIRDTLTFLLAGRTSIVIAHRLSTIRQAGRILVFHKGSIVENGTHEALLAKGGVYSRLHALQSLEELAEAS